MKKKVICLLLAVILLVGCGSAYMMTANAANDDDRSFFPLGSAASAAFAAAVYDTNMSLDFSNIDSKTGDSYARIGNYGGVMGYTSGEDGVIMGWLQNATSMAQSEVSYAALQVVKDCSVPGKTAASWDNPSEVEKSAVWYYCQYGYLLNDLGFDKTGGNGMHPLKFISGFVLMLGYMCSLIVPAVFKGILDLLKILNPFQLFFQLSTIKPDALFGHTITEDGPPTVLAGLGQLVSSWYAAFQSFSEFFLIPMMFFFVMLTFVLGKASNNMGKLRKFLTRVAIIFLCIPICGACYTGALEQAGESAEIGFSQSSRIIKSTLIDFERWAQMSHLKPTKPLYFGNADDDGTVAGEAGEDTVYGLRGIALAVNNLGISSSSSSYIPSSAVVADDVKDALTGVDEKSNAYWDTVAQQGGSLQLDSVLDTLDLIARHMTADFYTASDFESYAKAQMTSTGSGITTEDMDKVWKASNDVKDFNSSDKFSFNDEAISSLPALNIWADGGLYTSGYYFYSASGVPYGLSTMSMYNYLNTKFDRTGATMYTVDASSDFVRQSHYSVNLIGNNVMAVLYWADAVVMLVAVTLVGLCYAVSMLVGVVRRSLRFISSVPFALMGSLKAGARIITYVAMMLIEIIGTFWVYDMVTDILLSVPVIIEAPIESTIRSVFNDAAAVESGGEGVILASTVMIGVMLLNIIIVIAFTVMALRLRKAILKSLDEAAAGIIEKFIVGGSQPTASMAPAGGNFKNGFGQGALMGAAANRNGRDASGKDGKNKDGVKGTSKNAKSSENIGGSGIEGGAAQEGPTMETKGLSSGGGDMGGAASMSGDMGSMSAAGGASGTATAGATGTPGAGSAAGIMTDKAFHENNQAQADKDLGEKLLGGNMIEKHKKHKRQQEANDRAFMAEAMGHVGAIQEENIAEQTREARKQANKEQAMAAAQAVVGVAEIAGAAATGDVSLAEDGVKNTVNGVAGVRDADEKKKDIKAEESEWKIQTMESNRAEQSVSSQNSLDTSTAEDNMVTESGTSNSKTLQSQDSTSEDYTGGDATSIQYDQISTGRDIHSDSKAFDRLNQNQTKTVEASKNQKVLTMDGKTSSSAKSLSVGGFGMGTGSGSDMDAAMLAAAAGGSGSGSGSPKTMPTKAAGGQHKGTGTGTGSGVQGQQAPKRVKVTPQQRQQQARPQQRQQQQPKRIAPAGTGQPMRQQRQAPQPQPVQQQPQTQWPKPSPGMRPVKAVRQDDMSIGRGAGIPQEFSKGNFSDIPPEVYDKYGIDYNDGDPQWSSWKARDKFWRDMGFIPDWNKGILYAPGKK